MRYLRHSHSSFGDLQGEVLKLLQPSAFPSFPRPFLLCPLFLLFLGFGDGVVLRLLQYAHSHHSRQSSVPFRPQCLCQSIRYHVFRRTVFQACCSILDTVPDEVILYIDMLGSCMMFWVVCECDGALAVSVNDILIADIIAEFLEKAVYPDQLFQSMEECHVLWFCAREGD